jgi:hypothetical protein
MGLYNDNMNGEWKGRGYFFQIIDKDELPDALNYIEISHKGLFAYDS